jgi:hypothetical protein
VVVRISQSTLNRRPWLRILLGELKVGIDSADGIQIEAFSAIAMRSAAARFKANGQTLETAAVPATFRSMPMRAVWCSALFWVALERAQHATTGQRRTLDSFAPKQVAVAGGLLAKLRNSELNSARKWAHAFETEALRLRNIPPRVQILEPDGRKRPLVWHIYAAYPVLLAAPTTLDADDNLIAFIDRPLEKILRDSDRIWIAPTIDALFPDSGAVEQVDGRDPAGDWLRKADGRLRSNASRPEQRRALEATIPLVRLSRIVPGPAGQIPAVSGGSNVIL